MAAAWLREGRWSHHDCLVASSHAAGGVITFRGLLSAEAVQFFDPDAMFC